MKTSPIFKACLIAALPAGCLLAGCAAVLIGLGAGAGTFAYIEGNLTKIYAADFGEATQASTEALNQLRIPPTDRSGDEAKTTLAAKRADGTPVAIVISKRDKSRTEIGVRTGVVGIWDRNASMQIHEAIAEQLDRKTKEGSVPPSATDSLSEDAKPAESAPSLKAESKPVKKPPAKAAEKPAQREDPTPTPARRDLGENQLKMINFERGSIDFPGVYRSRLDRIAATMRSDPTAAVTLHGYSDALGSSTQNLVVSAKRAQAVKAYLIDKGVNSEQIIIIAHGATDFLGNNDTEEGRQQNRRVEIEPHNFKLD